MRADTDIAYVISHGFAARMVMQTNLLGRLVAAGLRVALIAPDAKDANLVKYCHEAQVSLYGFAPENARMTSEYAFARKYLLEDIEANPALLEKHIYATRFAEGKNPWKRLRPYLLYAAYRMAKRFPAIRSWYRTKEAKAIPSSEAEALIEKLQPRLTVATYPVNFGEASLLDAAEKAGRQTAIHLLSWDNISCKGHFPKLADNYLAWGPVMREELQAYYHVAKQNIHVCGVPHFDLHFQSKNNPQAGPHLEKLRLATDRPYLFFGMSSPRFAPREIDIVEWLAAKIKTSAFLPGLQLVIRPHPQNVSGSLADPSWLPRLQALIGQGVGIDFPNVAKSKMNWSMQQEDMIGLSQLMAGSAVTFNSGSTLSIDALCCGVPVVLTSFDGDEQLPYWQSARRLIDYVHLRKLIEPGGVVVSRSYTDLQAAIECFLKQPDHLLEERKHTLARACGTVDGRATERAVNALTQLLMMESSETVEAVS